MDEFELKAHVDKRGEETFRRLHLLTAKGYVAQLGGYGGVEDAIFLEHLGNSPGLILYPDGMIVCNDHPDQSINPSGDDDDRIFNDGETDARAFDRFLATVAEPTWRERSRADRSKYVYTPACLIVMVLTLWGVAWIIGEAWKSITS